MCEACDIEVLAKDLQRRKTPDSASAVGKGKLVELKEVAENLEANCLVYDGELRGSQMAAIADLTDLKVLDRTLLILDIFARRANTAEGVLQVEIAQLQDRLTRLSGSGQALSRLGGGIGTRGPGESQLESDRRHIQRRITTLSKKLKQQRKRRQNLRSQRKQKNSYVFAVCGYTNAGKSSLINALCHSDLAAFDQVFATLDPRLRRLPVEGPDILISDTVGLIRRLPHELVEAFQATLDEVREADYIIQVSDLSDPEVEKHKEVTDRLIQDLDAADKPRIHVLNKIDCIPLPLRPNVQAYYDPKTEITEIAVSVKENIGLELLQKQILDLVSRDWREAELLIDYARQEQLAYLKENSWIETINFEDEGSRVKFKAPPAVLAKLQIYKS